MVKRKKDGPRLRWTHEEAHLVVTAAAKHRLAMPPLGISDALKAAQMEVLPEHRRRDAFLPTNLTALRGPLEAAVNQLREKRALEKVATDAKDQAEAVAAANEPISPINGSELHLDLSGRGALDDLLAAFCDSVADRIAAGLRAGLASKLRATVLHATNVVTQTAAKQKRKAVIVGLLDGQAKMIERDYCDLFDLKFYGSNTPMQQVTQAANNADSVFMMAGFVGHNVQGGLPKEKTILVHGGMTDLRARLEQVFTRT